MNSVTYILYAEGVDYCLLVDCGEYATVRPVLDLLQKRVKAVLLTHCHSDHVLGLAELLKDFPDAEVYSNEVGHVGLRDSRKNLSFYHGTPYTVNNYKEVVITNGSLLHFIGFVDVEVIGTPGHDESCLTFKIGKDLFTGDSYIPGLQVFSKFPRGDKEKARKSMEILKSMESDGFIIHCGHHSYNNIK